MIPDPWAFALLALAAFRVWKLLADDTILDVPRDALIDRLVNARAPFTWGGEKRAAYWSDFLRCPWCTGFWIAGAWWLAWYAFPTGALVAATPFALSALVAALALALDRLAAE